MIGSPLAPGVYRTELWARGEPRLRIECAVREDGSGEITHFEEIPHGATYPKEAGILFRYVAATPDKEPPYLAPIDSKAWKKHELEDQYPVILETLKAEKPKRINVSKMDPPYPRNMLTKALTLPVELSEWPEDAVKASAGKTYLHQGLRALDAVVVANQFKEKRVTTKLGELLDHPHERIRQAVYLTYSHAPVDAIPLDLLFVSAFPGDLSRPVECCQPA